MSPCVTCRRNNRSPCLCKTRWLLDNDHDEEGMVVIANLYGSGDLHSDKARQEYREIKMNVLLQRQEGERSYTDMFRRYYKRVLIAMSAQALAQLNGINVISYYAPLVFESAGWAGRDAILMTGINAISYLASTVPPWYLVDRWGRRPILLSGAVAMIISLSLISYFIYIDVVATPTLTVIFVMIYNAAFGASWGPIPWLYPPEILPLSIRAKGASLSTATNWAFNWLVGEVTPVLQAAIKWRLYLVHAFFCACSFVLGKRHVTFSLWLTIRLIYILQSSSYIRKRVVSAWKTWTCCLGMRLLPCQHQQLRENEAPLWVLALLYLHLTSDASMAVWGQTVPFLAWKLTHRI